MKVRSSVSPEPIWIRCVENGEAKVRLRQNVVLKADDEEKLEHTYYEWDEVELSITDRENLLGYVQENFETLFDYGLVEESKPKPKTAKELRDEQIKMLQEQNLELSEMNIMLYESNIELSEFVVGLYEMILGGEV